MVMSKSYGVAAALIGGAMLALQGCGGGGGGPSGPTPAPPPVGPTPAPPPKPGPSGLYWCEDMPTYYKITFSNGTKSASGQCLPSTAPGAYYTDAGQNGTDGKNDRSWSCWNENMEHSLWTNAAAKAMDPPFAGACMFKDFGSKATPGDVEWCSKHLDHNPSVCSPGPSTFWGACWSSFSENWKCIPKGDKTIPGLAKGDCKSQVLLEPDSSVPTKHFFEGACRFQAEEPKVYKCDTVPDYDKSQGSTCGQDVDTKSDQACFSLTQDAPWQCVEKGSSIGTPCDWTLQPGEGKAFYSGYCVFPQNDKYKSALDAHNLTTAFDQKVIV